MRWDKVFEKWWKAAILVAVVTAAPVFLSELSGADSMADIHWVQVLDRMAIVALQAVVAGTINALNNYRKHRGAT